MTTIRETVHPGEKPPVWAAQEVREAKKKPIVYDEDCPPLTEEQLAEMAAAARARKTSEQRVPVGLRIKKSTLDKAKAVGKGYTGFLARLIDNAIDDEELVRKSL